MVAWNGDGVWPSPTFNVTHVLTDTFSYAGGTTLTTEFSFIPIDDDLLTLGAVTVRMKWMEYMVSCVLNALADGVVASVVVVVTHA